MKRKRVLIRRSLGEDRDRCFSQDCIRANQDGLWTAAFAQESGTDVSESVSTMIPTNVKHSEVSLVASRL